MQAESQNVLFIQLDKARGARSLCMRLENMLVAVVPTTGG